MFAKFYIGVTFVGGIRGHTTNCKYLLIYHRTVLKSTMRAGPLFTEDPVDTSKNLYAYILIFVCATTRNIHQELLNNMVTEVFLQGLRSFVSRGGTPSQGRIGTYNFVVAGLSEPLF